MGPSMHQPDQPVGQPTIGMGVLLACIGGYFILVGAGLLPPPGDEPARAPGWVAFAAGLAFLLGGIAEISQVRATAQGDIRPDGQLGETAPGWRQAVHNFVGLGVAACLAGIGTWIALGGDARNFSVPGPVIATVQNGEWIARTVFGFGAAVMWLFVIGVAVQRVRAFFRRPR
jgi:hypothetical protein